MVVYFDSVILIYFLGTLLLVDGIETLHHQCR
jgi:hypothetical protein